MFVAAKNRKDTTKVTRKHKFFSDTERTNMSKNLDEIAHLQSEKIEEWKRKVRRKIPHGTVDSWSREPPAANSSAVLLPEKIM